LKTEPSCISGPENDLPVSAASSEAPAYLRVLSRSANWRDSHTGDALMFFDAGPGISIPLDKIDFFSPRCPPLHVSGPTFGVTGPAVALAKRAEDACLIPADIFFVQPLFLGVRALASTSHTYNYLTLSYGDGHMTGRPDTSGAGALLFCDEVTCSKAAATLPEFRDVVRVGPGPGSPPSLELRCL